MDWRIDAGDDRAPYDQLRIQIIEDIRSGRLLPGARMPTVRDLAASAGVAVNTAARTYRELEWSGMIETRGRAGSFVLAQADSVESTVVALTREYLDEIRALGLDEADAIARIRAVAGTE